MSRADVAQEPPPAGSDLSGFPTDATIPGRAFRAHDPRFSAWFFSSTGAGRFDLEAPRGTCYVADSVRTAVREKLGQTAVGTKAVAESVARTIMVSTVEMPVGRFANTSDEHAEDFGVTRELTVMGDYTVTHSWAEALADAGFNGIRYASRYTTSPGPNSWAIFGPAGPDPGRSVFEAGAISGRDACEAAGLFVRGAPPDRSTLNVIPPPPGS
ncbi:RES family NAD+ phosphorylase [Glaciibacter sp. 2TAF33]|uniref:RES family NAD+ phosphorylase n=1 Tax=Glaciibacter sp. 2TAF33 TaxID=3233015 RepID=UPI003F919E99